MQWTGNAIPQSSLWWECYPADIIVGAWRDPEQRIQVNHENFAVTGYMSLENHTIMLSICKTILFSRIIRHLSFISRSENYLSVKFLLPLAHLLQQVLNSTGFICRDAFSTPLSPQNLGSPFEYPVYAKFRINFTKNLSTFFRVKQPNSTATSVNQDHSTIHQKPISWPILAQGHCYFFFLLAFCSFAVLSSFCI